MNKKEIFIEIMREVEEKEIPFLRIDRGDEGIYIRLSERSILNIEGSLFLLPANFHIKVNETGIAMEMEPREECKGCSEECYTQPIGTEKDMEEYAEMRRRENGEDGKEIDPKEPLDLSLFNRKGNC
jgi:hypothetical protein